MGTFAETANVGYRLSFADQEKQTSIYHFQFAANKRCCYPNIYISIYPYIYIYIYIYAAVSNGKWKMEAHAIFLNPMTFCSSCKRKFVVCPFVYDLPIHVQFIHIVIKIRTQRPGVTLSKVPLAATKGESPYQLVPGTVHLGDDTNNGPNIFQPIS
jgi:hypothetical protein